MTTPLYRKEVKLSRNAALSGDVILRRHVPSLVITGLLLLAAALIAGMLLLGKVDTPDGPVRILDWLIGRAG